MAERARLAQKGTGRDRDSDEESARIAALWKDNYKLVYLVAKKMGGNNYEDFVGPLYMVFVKLARWYNPERAKFSTYYVRYAAKLARAMMTADYDYFPTGTKLSAYDHDDATSYEEHKRREKVSDPDVTADEVDIAAFREFCRDCDKQLFDLVFVEQLNNVEIGAVFGISRERVRQKKTRMLNRIRDNRHAAMTK